MRNEGVNALVDVLKDHGYSVKRNATLTGYSGIKHKFDVIAEKGEITLFFNFTNDVRVKFEYLSMIGKYMDLKNSGTKFFLMVSAKDEQRLEELCSEVGLITYADLNELVDKVQRTLEEIELS